MIDLAGFGQQLLQGAAMTVQLAVAAVAVGLVLGLIGGVGRLSRFAAARAVASAASPRPGRLPPPTPRSSAASPNSWWC